MRQPRFDPDRAATNEVVTAIPADIYSELMAITRLDSAPLREVIRVLLVELKRRGTVRPLVGQG